MRFVLEHILLPIKKRNFLISRLVLLCLFFIFILYFFTNFTNLKPLFILFFITSLKALFIASLKITSLKSFFLFLSYLSYLLISLACSNAPTNKNNSKKLTTSAASSESPLDYLNSDEYDLAELVEKVPINLEYSPLSNEGVPYLGLAEGSHSSIDTHKFSSSSDENENLNASLNLVSTGTNLKVSISGCASGYSASSLTISSGYVALYRGDKNCLVKL